MRVRAKHWLKVNGTWFRCGDVFTLSAADAEKLRGSVDMLEETPVSKAEAEIWDLGDPVNATADNQSAVEAEPVKEEPKKRRRTTKKAAE